MAVYPNRKFSQAIIVRASVLWLSLRMVAAGVRALRGAGPLEALSPAAVVYVIILSAALTLFEVRRSGEELFLADLGVPLTAVGSLAMVPPLMLELAVDVWLL